MIIVLAWTMPSSVCGRAISSFESFKAKPVWSYGVLRRVSQFGHQSWARISDAEGLKKNSFF